MDGNSEQLQVINLKQLPIIEERLRDVKAKIEQRTSAVMALAVTEETRTDVKKIRTEVRKELEGYEAQRMAVKKAIMTPYEQFEAVYKECVSNPYKCSAALPRSAVTLKPAQRKRTTKPCAKTSCSCTRRNIPSPRTQKPTLICGAECLSKPTASPWTSTTRPCTRACFTETLKCVCCESFGRKSTTTTI